MVPGPDDSLSTGRTQSDGSKEKNNQEWILRRKEAWRFQEELLRSLTIKPTKDSRVLEDLPSQKAREMGAVHEELLRNAVTRERNMADSRMYVPRRVFLFNVDTFKNNQQVEGFENPKVPVPDPGISVSRSTLEVDGSVQGHVKPAAAKCLCEVKHSKGQGVFRRLKKYFGF